MRKLVVCLMTVKSSVKLAGADAPALIKKRGARMGVFQKGRLPRPDN